MRQVLIGLIVADVLVLGAAMVLGWTSYGPRSFALHFGLGLFGTIYTTLLHSIVYVYFIVSGKLVREAVERSRLNPLLFEQSQQLKSKTFRFALTAILAVIGSALLGGYVSAAGSLRDGSFDRTAASSAIWMHSIVSIVAFLAQPAVAILEYRNVARQQQLTAAALAAHTAMHEERRRSLNAQLEST